MSEKQSWSMAQFLFNIIVSIMILVGGWHINLTMRLADKIEILASNIAVLETKSNHNDLYHETISETLTQLCDGINIMNIYIAKLPTEIPPPWFKEQVDENTKDIALLKETSYGYQDYIMGKRRK